MTKISFTPNPQRHEASATLAGNFLYWGKQINPFELALDRIRRIAGIVRVVVFIAILIASFGYFVMETLVRYDIEAVGTLTFWKTPHLELLTFWIGMLVVLYGISRIIRARDTVAAVQKRMYTREGGVDALGATSFAEKNRFARKHRIDIAKSFNKEAMRVVRRAYQYASASHHHELGAHHLIAALLEQSSIQVVFGRMGVHKDRITEPLGRVLAKEEVRAEGSSTILGVDCFEILFDAYHYAYAHRSQWVSPVAILVAAVQHSPAVQEILYSLDIEQKKLENVAAWMRISEQLRERYYKFRASARLRPKGGMNRAMTALATPELDKVSQDLTQIAQMGSLPPLIGREHEMVEMFRIFEGGAKSVVLVGLPGVGKNAIVEGVAERMINEEVPGALTDKRMVILSISALTAGVDPSMAQERLLIVLGEVARAGNIILVVPDVHGAIGVSVGEGIDLADTLASEVAKGYFLCIATTENAEYAQLVEQSKLGRVLEKVVIKEMDEDTAIQVLEAKTGSIEYEQKVFFSYDALAAAVRLSSKYMHERFLPDKAIEVIKEAAQKVHAEHGENQIIRAEDVAVIVSDKTSIPVTQVTQEESQKLLNLEEEMHKRVIGQDEAVKAIAAALRRARAELREGTRPIANFLFLGPTGVGKTELAKTVAATYFGNQENMVRLDMSEYQNKEAIAQLIGAPGGSGGGVLSEAIRKQPFTVLLLDELEKAHPDILNVFLQVMDDGRLTDNAGRVIDFTNVILIATSNAGTQVIQDQVHAGVALDEIKQRLMNETLRENYRPEFLNRFDGIIVFKPLTADEITQIAWLMIARIQKQLEGKGITLEVEDAAIEELAHAGFDPTFGARPLRRVIQERVQDALANFLLTQKIGRRDVVVLKSGGELEVKKAEAL